MNRATEVPTVWNQLAEAMYLKDSPTAKVKLSEHASFSFGRFQSSEGLPEIARPITGEKGFIVALQLKAIPYIEQFFDKKKVSSGSYPIGGVSAIDLQEEPAVLLPNPFDALVLYVTQAALDKVAYAHGARRVEQLVWPLGHSDPVVYHLGKTLLSSLEQPHNGLVDFFVTDFGDDYKVLYHNDGHAGFTDVSHDAGIAQTTVPFVGWGDGFIDYDNDGWLDLFMVNGHVYPQVDQHAWGTSFAQRPLLFHNVPDRTGKGRRFEYIPPVTGTGLAVVVPGRGAAFGDLFNDGKIDVVINPIDGPPVLLRNVNPDRHHWVEVKLVGGPKSPRDATCATGYLTANGMRQRQDVLASGSYIGSNDRRLHFGLGDTIDPGSLEIHWPSGKKETVKLPAIDRMYTITEGTGITGELCGGKECAQSGAARTSAVQGRP